MYGRIRNGDETYTVTEQPQLNYNNDTKDPVNYMAVEAVNDRTGEKVLVTWNAQIREIRSI